MTGVDDDLRDALERMEERFGADGSADWFDAETEIVEVTEDDIEIDDEGRVVVTNPALAADRWFTTPGRTDLTGGGDHA